MGWGHVGMSSGARSKAQQQQVAHRLEDIISELVPEGEIVTHFDVVVQTRSRYAARQMRFWLRPRRWCTSSSLVSGVAS